MQLKEVLLVTGWLQLKLIEKANEGKMASRSDSDLREETRTGISAAIERLGENLSK